MRSGNLGDHVKDGNASPDSQDLYARWLNIPPGPRPPDHYTLLGLPLFTADLQEIEAAAHRQLDLLDVHALHLDPEKRAACQRLMNEVAQARSVLADPHRRVDYDCTLLIQHGVAGAPLPSSRDSRQPVSIAPLAPPPEAGSFAPIRARLSRPLSVALLVGAMIAVGSLVVWGWVLHSGERPMETAVALPVSATPGKELSLDLGGAMMRFVYIPPGTFFMGSPDYDKDRFYDEVPSHPVTLTKGFYMAITEVTQEQYQAVMGRKFKDAKNPVEMVSWDEATEFCRQVSEKTGRKARLPTEAEWEYACRAGTTSAFSFGDNDRALGDYAWYYGNSGGKAHPVGQKKPNAWGLYDMHGNVDEWCADLLWPYAAGTVTDPTGPDCGACRVLRGGDRNNNPSILRSACRAGSMSSSRIKGTGFRVVVESSPTVPVQAPSTPAPVPTTPPKKEAPTTVPAGSVDIGLSDLPRVGKLVIVKAEYGNLPSGRKVDVTKKVAEMVKNDTLSVNATNDNFTDPCDQIPKQLRVDYTINGILATKIVNEKENLTVSGSDKKDASVTAPAAVVVSPPSAPVPAPPAPAAQGKELSLNLGNGATMKLVLISPGTFIMGSPDSEQGPGREAHESPQHEVTITKPFYMGVTEVTQAQYEAVMGTNPSAFKGPTNPVEQVSWNDATEFCKKLSEKTRKVVRLPTEAEWEYACRAGSKTRFSFGDSDSVLGDYAWWKRNSESRTHPVGQKKPNAWGLYDMHGNVREWCADRSGPYSSESSVDPQGATSGGDRVVRGGSWLRDATGHFRCAVRDGVVPTYRAYGHDGFRVVVDSAPTVPVQTPPATNPAGQANTLSAAERAAGWRLLFDGTLESNAWHEWSKPGLPDGWRVSDGCLFYDKSGSRHQLLATAEEFDDFEFSFQWKVSRGANSGVLYRVQANGNLLDGAEYNIVDNAQHEEGRVPRTSCASVYDLVAPVRDVTRPVGEFNDGRIVCRGSHVEHWLNGEKVLEYDTQTDAWRASVAASKFKGNLRFAASKKGHIVLQGWRPSVWFRNLKIRPLNVEQAVGKEWFLGRWQFQNQPGVVFALQSGGSHAGW
jgi:formylglycine-generating enzyme required for sulfatase activity